MIEIKKLWVVPVFFLLTISVVFGRDLTVNLNEATQEQLMELKGIGPVRSKKIIESRKTEGPFRQKDEILTRKLVPNSVYENIRSRIAVSGKTETPKLSRAKISEILSGNRFKGEFWLLADGEFYRVLADKITKAKHSVLLSTFVFKTSASPKNRANKIAEALKKARDRGLTVRAVLERSSYSDSINETNGSSRGKLLKHGVDARFDDPGRTLHSKIVVIDGEWSFVGSHNITHSALGKNREVSLMVRSKKLAGRLTDYVSEL